MKLTNSAKRKYFTSCFVLVNENTKYMAPENKLM